MNFQWKHLIWMQTSQNFNRDDSNAEKSVKQRNPDHFTGAPKIKVSKIVKAKVSLEEAKALDSVRYSKFVDWTAE